MKHKKKIFTEERIVLIIRWWVAGAIYFFVGWGTGLGNKNNLIDLVFFLGLSLGLVNSFVLNPVLNKMFNLKTSKNYMDISIADKVKTRLTEILHAMFIVVIMFYCYGYINRSLIQIYNLSPESVPFPGEPITFGILYVILYVLMEKLKRIFIKGRKE